MKRMTWAALLLAASGASLACDATGAFGFEFGKPVPQDASKTLIGGSVKNAMGCFDGMVPAPAEPFEGYAYCANRDRKFVYAIEASRIYADGKILDADKPDAAEMYAMARAAIAEIKETWEKKFGLVYKAENDRGIRWEAETPTVRSTITIWGPKVVVDCTNKSLEAQAMKAAMGSM
jgi:hypothetical protein